MTIVKHTLSKKFIERFQKKIQVNVDNIIDEINSEMMSLDACKLDLKDDEELSIDFDQVWSEIEPLINRINKIQKMLNRNITKVCDIFWFESL